MKIYFVLLGFVITITFLLDYKYNFNVVHSLSSAQISCCNPPPKQLPTVAKWAKNATVTVKISNVFTETEKSAVKDSFEAWNDNKLLNCSNVNFVGFESTNETPSPLANTHWVVYEDYFNEYAAGLTGISGDGVNGGAVEWARTTLFKGIRSGRPSALPPYIRGLMRHEIGHTFYLANADNCLTVGSTVMYTFADARNVITSCDNNVVQEVYCPAPTPSPTPTPTPSSCPFSIFPNIGGTCPVGYYPDANGSPYCCPRRGWCNGLPDYDQYPTGCAQGFVLNGNGYCTRNAGFASQCYGGGYDVESCACFGGCEDGACSPVVIDTSGNGFVLTNALNGVDFDVDGDGVPERRAWTTINSDDAWLVLDRNRNGVIDDGRELFGSVAPQPPPPVVMEYNGFNALGMMTNRDSAATRTVGLTGRTQSFLRCASGRTRITTARQKTMN